MTYFAKWREADLPTPDIVCGSCERDTFPAQAQEGETLVAMDDMYWPPELYVGEDGYLHRASDDAIVEVPYLDDELLLDFAMAIAAQSNSDRTLDAVQRLRGAQTVAEAEAALLVNDLAITPDELAQARRERNKGQD
jgi:hypothetical protein